jgi:hypothetical protein
MKRIGLIALAVLAFAGTPTDPRQAHAYADGVLFPRFTAAMNEFSFEHPKDREGDAHRWEHVKFKSDVKDRQLFTEACRAFDEWKRAMKRAGYSD